MVEIDKIDFIRVKYLSLSRRTVPVLVDRHGGRWTPQPQYSKQMARCVTEKSLFIKFI